MPEPAAQITRPHPGSRLASTAPDEAPRSPRAATVGFTVLALCAVVVIRWRSRSQFFFQDEWTVLAGRDLSWSSLIEPHWGHCIVLPSIAYHALYEVFGLNTYAPYQALVVGAHLVVVASLRQIMIRAAVNTWIVLSVCTLMLVLGAGQPDVAWGFQVTLTGSLALALLAVVLLDHQRPASDRRGWGRDAPASLCLVASVLCSGVGALMLPPIGVIVAVRAGVRRAVAVLAAPVAVQGAWMLGAPPSPNAPPPVDFIRAIGFGARLVSSTVVGVSGSAAVAWLLLALFVVGTATVVVQTSWSHFRSRHLTASLLLASAAAIAVTIGRTRAEIIEPDSPRYIYLVAALALPALAVAMDHVARGRAPLVAAACLLVLAAVPANIHSLAPLRGRAGQPTRVYALAQQGDRLGVRGDYRPFPTVGFAVTISYLAEAHRTGRTRELPADHPALEAALLELALVPTTDVWGLGCPTPTTTTATSETIRLHVGDRFRTQGSPVAVSRAMRPDPVPHTIPAHSTVAVAWGPLALTGVGAEPLVLCGR